MTDNIELSAIVAATTNSNQGKRATFFTGLIEPSVHLPVAESLFAFLGLGVGGTYEQSVGGGLALAPRIGMNALVGRSGILTLR